MTEVRKLSRTVITVAVSGSFDAGILFKAFVMDPFMKSSAWSIPAMWSGEGPGSEDVCCWLLGGGRLSPPLDILRKPRMVRDIELLFSQLLEIVYGRVTC